MFYRIAEVQARPAYRVWERPEDSTEGEVDLSDLIGKGVFSAWHDPREFDKVYIGDTTGTIAWRGGIDLAPDAPY
jgi:hypothetical protein